MSSHRCGDSGGGTGGPRQRQLRPLLLCRRWEGGGRRWLPVKEEEGFVGGAERGMASTTMLGSVVAGEGDGGRR